MKRSGHILELVDAYLHGSLLPDDAVNIEEHCEACRICQVALEEARARFEALQAIPPVEASEQLIRDTLQKVRLVDQRRRTVRKRVTYSYFLATAASIAIVGALHMYYARLAPTPYDLQVYGQRELLAGTEGALRVRLADHHSREALRGVPVDIELRDHRGGEVFRLASFTTDELGTGNPRFRWPDAQDGDYELRVVARVRGTDEVIARTVALKRSWKLMLSTDKPLYQPGQTIHIRSLALRRPDLRPVAGQQIGRAHV